MDFRNGKMWSPTVQPRKKIKEPWQTKFNIKLILQQAVYLKSQYTQKLRSHKRANHRLRHFREFWITMVFDFMKHIKYIFCVVG